MPFNNLKVRIPLFLLFQNILILNQNREPSHWNSKKTTHVGWCASFRIHPVLSALPMLTWKSGGKTWVLNA